MRSRSRFVVGSSRSDPLFAVAACMLIAALPAHAVEPHAPLSRSIRTHFTADDGLPFAVVGNIQQTRDGFLWMVVNGNSLVRFDGRNFQVIEGLRATALLAAPDGGLWVGSDTDLRFIPADALAYFDASGSMTYHPGPDKASYIVVLRFGRDGTMWVGTEAGLFAYDKARFMPVGPPVQIIEIEPAANGHLFVVTSEGLMEWDGSRLAPLPGPAAELGVGAKEIFHAREDTHGDVWYCAAKGIAVRSGSRLLRVPPFGPKGHGGLRTYEDGHGGVWAATAEGLFRATAAGLDLAVPKLQVRSLYVDRGGALWIGTNGDGLYRFKDPAVRMLTAADGLPNDVIMTVLAARDGSLWTGANCGGITHIDGTEIHTYAEKDGLLNSCVNALAEDARHDLWIGTYGGGAFRFHEGHFTQFLAGRIVFSIVAARDGSVWFATEKGIGRLRNETVRMFTVADGLRKGPNFKILEDHAGAILTGNWSGIDRLVGDRFERLPGVPEALALPMGEDRSGALFIDLEEQPAALRIEGNRIDGVVELHGENSLIQTESGDLWFAGFGARRLPPESFARSRPPDEPLDDEVFGIQDGLATMESSTGRPNMAVARDGTLCIATPRGLAVLDPRLSPRTADPPTIYVREVTVGRETRPASRELVLPPGTSHTELAFAAVEASSPERVRMQYRLDGVDAQWLDAGPSPRATYSSIPVGKHALRIRACNRSGIWGRDGISYFVTQQPLFYQTRWFLAVTTAAGLLFVGGAYRLRVSQVSRQLSARFDERLAYRTRVARDLHDTFLQTVQGSKLVVDHALKDPDDPARLLRAVKQLSGWLDRAIEEGRAALNSLRTSTAETNDLTEALRLAVDDCRAQTGIDATLSVTGHAGELHPVVRDEVYRIGSEAIRNARQHSGAGILRVTLEHDHDFTLSVLDDGVGMDPGVSETGKGGHFGLSGMRERAENIGGKLTIARAPGPGTTVTVTVPGRLAYRTRRPGPQVPSPD